MLEAREHLLLHSRVQPPRHKKGENHAPVQLQLRKVRPIRPPVDAKQRRLAWMGVESGRAVANRVGGVAPIEVDEADRCVAEQQVDQHLRVQPVRVQ